MTNKRDHSISIRVLQEIYDYQENEKQKIKDEWKLKCWEWKEKCDEWKEKYNNLKGYSFIEGILIYVLGLLSASIFWGVILLVTIVALLN